jgi:hypothetical protein
MVKVHNLDINFVNYFELSFIMTVLDNLDTNLRGYSKISLIMDKSG